MAAAKEVAQPLYSEEAVQLLIRGATPHAQVRASPRHTHPL